jgi:hypothetical protein
MKLYATVTSDRASKGQGGNKGITIELMVGSKKNSRKIAALCFNLNPYNSNEYYLSHHNWESKGVDMRYLQRGEIEKGKQQKGEKPCSMFEFEGKPNDSGL